MNIRENLANKSSYFYTDFRSYLYLTHCAWNYDDEIGFPWGFCQHDDGFKSVVWLKVLSINFYGLDWKPYLSGPLQVILEWGELWSAEDIQFDDKVNVLEGELYEEDASRHGLLQTVSWVVPDQLLRPTVSWGVLTVVGCRSGIKRRKTF